MKQKMNYFLTPSYAIPEETKFKRIGIVPYFKENDIINFFLMLDSTYKELTDCGGLPHKNEYWIDTAIRETNEESRGKFIFSKEQILNEGYVYWREDNRIAIVFINITNYIPSKQHAENKCNNYKTDYLKGIAENDRKCRLENSDMFFFEAKEIKIMSRKENIIYTPVKMLFQKLFAKKILDQLS